VVFSWRKKNLYFFLAQLILSIIQLKSAPGQVSLDGARIEIRELISRRDSQARYVQGQPPNQQSVTNRSSLDIYFFSQGNVASVQGEPLLVCLGADGSLSATAIIYHIGKTASAKLNCRPQVGVTAVSGSLKYTTFVSYKSNSTLRGATMNLNGTMTRSQKFEFGAGSSNLVSSNLSQKLAIDLSENGCSVRGLNFLTQVRETTFDVRTTYRTSSCT
jgi:hypothetical protein